MNGRQLHNVRRWMSVENDALLLGRTFFAVRLDIVGRRDNECIITLNEELLASRDELMMSCLPLLYFSGLGSKWIEMCLGLVGLVDVLNRDLILIVLGNLCRHLLYVLVLDVRWRRIKYELGAGRLCLMNQHVGRWLGELKLIWWWTLQV